MPGEPRCFKCGSVLEGQAGIAGHVSLAMEDWGASRLTLITVADWLRSPRTYASKPSWERAMRTLAGEDAEALEALRTQALEWGGPLGGRNYHTALTDNPFETRRVIRDPALVSRWRWTLTRYPQKEAALLPALRLAEKEFGNLGPAELKYVADLMGLSPAKVYGVFTFYTHFRRQGTGRYNLQVCATLSCALRGAEDLVSHIEGKLGIEIGESTPDGRIFLKREEECLAACCGAPMMQVNHVYHENLTPEKVDDILDGLE